MHITPQNWMSLVAASLDLLPADVKARVRVEPDVLDATQCRDCGGTYAFVIAGTRCAACNPNDRRCFNPVELSEARPRISLILDDRVVASAVLVRLPKRTDVVLPEAPSATFRVRSPAPTNSAEALQGGIRALVLTGLQDRTAGGSTTPARLRDREASASVGGTANVDDGGRRDPNVLEATADLPGVEGKRKEHIMKLTIRNWKGVIEGALQLLPPELQKQLVVQPKVIEPTTCKQCGGSWLAPEIDGLWCACSGHLPTIKALNCTVAHPQVVIELEGISIAAAVLEHGRTSTDLLVPGLYFCKFRTNSTKKENSSDALQRAIRAVVYPHFGLSTDRDGFWGWSGGERLEGGAMIPTCEDLMEEMMRLEEREPGSNDSQDGVELGSDGTSPVSLDTPPTGRAEGTTE